ncbi:hypothetical protein OROHE_009779 [Orobanche hederae]
MLVRLGMLAGPVRRQHDSEGRNWATTTSWVGRRQKILSWVMAIPPALATAEGNGLRMCTIRGFRIWLLLSTR